MIKCGIIGCGAIAPTHIAGINAIPEVKLEALCDIKPERLNALAEKHQVEKRYIDYHEMLADSEIDLIHVCTDHASHAQIVIDTLNAGKHLICEKSVGRTDDDLRIMAEAVKAHPELVASGIFQHRFVAGNIALRKLVADGVFGQGLMVNLAFCCRRTAEYYARDAWRGTIAGEGGGLLINQAIHHLDQLRFVFGEIKSVCAACANQTHQGVIEVEDAAIFTVEFESGLLGTVAAVNSSATNWRTTLTYTGTRATIETITEKPVFIDSLEPEIKEQITAALAPQQEEKFVGKSYYGSGHTAQIADVCRAIKTKTAPTVTLADALTSSSLVMAIYESSRNNGAKTFVKRYI